MTTCRKVLYLPPVEEKVVTVRLRVQAPADIPDGKLPLVADRLRNGVQKHLEGLGLVERPADGWAGDLGFAGPAYINIPNRVVSVDLGAVGEKADAVELALLTDS